ncbi:MAG: hypothetical protein ACREEE_14940 [Dongiaceae bacterium]
MTQMVVDNDQDFERRPTPGIDAPERMGTAATGDRAAANVLQSLRLTCRLLILHPWFTKGTRLPQAMPCQPLEIEDLVRLIAELSSVAKLVCVHREHADSHRDAYLGLLSQIVSTLNAPNIEHKLIALIGRSDADVIERELGNLRRLVIDSAQAELTDHQPLTLR